MKLVKIGMMTAEDLEPGVIFQNPNGGKLWHKVTGDREVRRRGDDQLSIPVEGGPHDYVVVWRHQPVKVQIPADGA